MAGTSGRSGGRNRKTTPNVVSDGTPQSPRVLSPRAETLFKWLSERLTVNDPSKGWRRADGVLLASLAEILESQEAVASQIADDPANVGLHRLRNNLTQQITRLSSLVGLCPFDRSRQPQFQEQTDDTEFVKDIFERMSRG